MQVDRLSFPCGCSKDGCSNPVGRIEFNPIRVRTHFIHTVMRIEMDRKREQITQMCAPRAAQCDFPPPGECNARVDEPTEDDDNNMEVPEDGSVTQDTEDYDSGVNSPEAKNTTEFTEENSLSNLDDSDRDSVSSGKSSQSDGATVSRRKPGKSCLKRRTGRSLPQLAQFNSNERGSCRDCGNTDVTEMLMAGAHFVESAAPPPPPTILDMDPIIPSQTKVIDCTGSGPAGTAPAAGGDAAARDSADANSDAQRSPHFQQVCLRQKQTKTKKKKILKIKQTK